MLRSEWLRAVLLVIAHPAFQGAITVLGLIVALIGLR
jgi:hypothetical protein